MVKEHRRISDFEGYRYPSRLPREQQMHDRSGDQFSFESQYNRLRFQGASVRTHVTWLVPCEEKRGFSHLADPVDGQVSVESPLLAITVEPYMDDFPVKKYRTPSEPFRCSLAHYWDLGPYIYEPGGIMEQLLKKFDNKFHQLRLNKDVGPKWTDENGYTRWSTGLELDENADPIATNEAARWAKSKGRFSNRHWHISL